MKRILCLILAAMMLISIVACGEKTPNVTDGTTDASGDKTEDPVTTEPVTTEDPNKLPDYIPTDKYDGHEFVVLMTNLNADAVIVRDFNWTEGGTVIDDALYKRNMGAMEALDITITGIEKYSSTNTGVADVRKANTAGDSSYDMCIISTYDAGKLALSKDLVNLRDYGVIDLDQAWWDQNINRDLTVNDKLYFTTGDISLVATQAMYNVVFNKDLYREKFGNTSDLYALVKEGKWTFDKMKEYVIQVSEDLDGNEIMDSNDLYGMVYIHSSVIAALGMSGERMAKIDENGDVVITLGTERAQDAIVNFIELTLDKQHVYNGQTATGGLSAVQMFSEGHCLFRWIEHLGFPHFRDTELDYGILPLPKTEDSQDRYYTPFGGWDAAFVCVPALTENVERTSAIIEYLAFTSKQTVTPAYYEKTLTGRYVRDDESFDMITLEMENRGFDIGYIYNIGNLKNAVENLSKSYSTAFSSMWNAYKNSATKQCTAVNKTLHE